MIPVFGESYSKLGVATVTPPGPNDDRNFKLLPCFGGAVESSLHFLESVGKRHNMRALAAISVAAHQLMSLAFNNS